MVQLWHLYQEGLCMNRIYIVLLHKVIRAKKGAKEKGADEERLLSKEKIH